MALNKYDCLWKTMSENIFEFNHDSINGLICVICNNVMIDVRQSKCGCLFCYKCILEYLGGNERPCPGGTEECLELLSLERDLIENIRICNKISKLKVKCLSRLCDSIVELMDMDKHLRLCTRQPMTCPYNVIGCDNMAIITQNEIFTHLNNEIFSHSILLKQYIEDLRNEMTELKNDNDLKAERIRTLENSTLEEMTRIKEEVEYWRRQSTKLEEDVTLIKSQIIAQKEDIQRDARVQEKEMIEEIVELKDGMKNQMAEIIKNEIITINNKITEQSKEIENKRQKEVDFLSLEINKLKNEIEDLKKQVANTKTEFENQGTESKKLRVIISSEIVTINNQIKEIKNQVQDSVITVFVKAYNESKTDSVQCNPNIKTENFISFIEQKGLILGELKLMFQGSYLKPGLSLKEQDICDGDSVIVVTFIKQ